MTLDEVMGELESMGTAQTKKTFMRHGAKEPYFGVKIGDMKKIQKKVKKDHTLSLALYDTGNADAMYLAGLISDPPKMTKPLLQKWVKAAYWHTLSAYTVAWVTAESNHGAELAREWIDSPKEQIATAGWSTLSSLVAIKDDQDLDLDELVELLDRVVKRIHKAQNRVKCVMNGFVIAVAGYVEPLLSKAKGAAKAIGQVDVDMGDTDCKVPYALGYIEMLEEKGRIGKKRKSAMC